MYLIPLDMTVNGKPLCSKCMHYCIINFHNNRKTTQKCLQLITTANCNGTITVNVCKTSFHIFCIYVYLKHSLTVKSCLQYPSKSSRSKVL